jgi:hypothetical protein
MKNYSIDEGVTNHIAGWQNCQLSFVGEKNHE